jgi:hypothetical protein
MSNITVHPLLQQVSSNLGTELYVVLSGYIGPSDEDIVRLYSSLEMSHYVDIPSRDVLAVSDADPNGRVKIFILGSAPIRLTKTCPAKAYEVFNGDENPGPPDSDGGDGRADDPVQTGGGSYALNNRLSMVMHFKKLFKRYN